MRAIDSEFQARLDSGASRMCRCWRVTRKDGVVLGFTDHDLDLKFEGVTFRASSGMDASALQTATGLSVDNAQAVGALSDAAVTEHDIRAGKFDRAEIQQWLVDWERPDLRVGVGVHHARLDRGQHAIPADDLGGGPALLDVRGGVLAGAGNIGTGVSVAGELRPGNPLGKLQAVPNWNVTNTPASVSVFQLGGTQAGVDRKSVV